MSLRMRILLFLFLFGLVPLMLAVVINLPLVLERVDLFYRHSFLQNLRADFSDLDQHLASRDASVRLLAKLPEPGALVGNGGGGDQAEIDLARARYTQWINRILGDERDITEILFLDENGIERFWLERESGSGKWQPTTRRLRGVPPDQVALLLSGRLSNVVLSPLRIDLTADDPARVFTLQLLSPIASATAGEPPIGLVAITLDIAGLVRRDTKTLWVHDDGRYLRLPDLPGREGNAFDDYPGLDRDFKASRVVLWEKGDKRAIWVPMFRTVDGHTLWVGRPVDDEPLQIFRTEIVLRVLLIVLGLVVLQFVVARWITRRAERFSRDLTEGVQKTLESDQPVAFNWTGSPELRQLAADLTRLSRTHASQTRNLRAHARELEATNRYKSQFLANVSHELRTPLNSILLLSKLLAAKGGELSDESQQQADVIHKAGCDLKALIDNILDLSRIEAGRLDLHVEPVVLAEVLEDLRLLLEPQFDAKGLHFELRIEEGAPERIETDVDKVRQVLKNFLANAVKFTEHGTVTLSANPAPAPYSVCLTVRDSGIGIPLAKQGAIFEAFQQADGSTSRRYGGTGLGLTISRQLAGLLGGEIRLVSEPGQGAEFSLLLPAIASEDGVRAAAPDYPVVSAAEEEAEPTPGGLQHLQVLLMEPDVRSQLRLSGLLRGWGMRLHLADDLEEAIETLDELDHVDFLLIDALMPDDGACVTIRKLREHLGAATVVVGLIPADRADARETCLGQGADDFVTMPCDARALSGVLVRHLPQTGE
ncbi:MAG: response regulator [Chromatiaceae bacterium]|nr:response regulator [Chromatiaceae bacterium]MCP5440132.1 response regulator [Chromatiaceae bacterium]